MPARRTPTVHHAVDRRLLAGWAALAALVYLTSAGVVRLYDSVGARALTASIVEQGGPLSRVTCDGCVSAPALAGVWLTDWRALVVWSVLVAVVAVLVVRNRRAARTR